MSVRVVRLLRKRKPRLSEAGRRTWGLKETIVQCTEITTFSQHTSGHGIVYSIYFPDFCNGKYFSSEEGRYPFNLKGSKRNWYH